MKNKIYWNTETINYFNFVSSYLTKKELLNKITEFVQIDCIPAEHQTEKDLINDLFNKINITK
jgi:hypothetical protein